MRILFTITPVVFGHLPLKQVHGFTCFIKKCLPVTPHSRFFSVYDRPWKFLTDERDNDSLVTAAKDKFEVSIDVQQFSPEEISVKIQDDMLIIQGHHEEKKDDYGFVSRQFIRRYLLPAGHAGKDVVCNLSSDGFLTVIAPKNKGDAQTPERDVPIAKTGAPRRLVGSGDSQMKKLK